ncbi:MAG: DUF1836 domain-containing protein [Oscillospiraceae bacterium]|nr:DUF1836 domain-containing protein [Oscillospiraceae bacterium]
MKWKLPGTTLEVLPEEMPLVEERFRAMFMAGGIALSQVAAITGLEPYTIQNWVKRGFLTSPQQKRYSLRQLCRILNINMLKDALAMDQICGLISYINGHLDDESDDIIDDSQLYFMFLRLASNHREMNNPAGREVHLLKVLADYREPFPGAGERVQQVLRTMLTAWAAAQLRQLAEKMVKDLKENDQ